VPRVLEPAADFRISAGPVWDELRRGSVERVGEAERFEEALHQKLEVDETRGAGREDVARRRPPTKASRPARLRTI
jgi:hypothetical protein